MTEDYMTWEERAGFKERKARKARKRLIVDLITHERSTNLNIAMPVTAPLPPTPPGYSFLSAFSALLSSSLLHSPPPSLLSSPASIARPTA
eukprot:763466-Hanusia_phi.AAC.5